MEENIVIEGALEKLKKGFDIVGDVVSTTLGPKGKFVLIDNNGLPYVTKDGVTVTKSIFLQDKYADYGASLIKQTAEKTVQDAGDGTTTSVILTRKMVDAGYDYLPNESAIGLVKGIDEAVTEAVNELKKVTIPVNDVETAKKIAYISSNNDSEISDLIGEALEKVGLDGTIHTANSGTNKTFLELTEGFKFNKGVVSQHFLDAGENTKTLHNPYIVVYNGDLTIFDPVLKTLQDIASEGNCPTVLMIAHSFSGKVLDNFILNNNGKIINICPVEAPSFGENRRDILEDIVILTSEQNTLLATNDKPIVGKAEKVVINRNSTVIFNGKGNEETIASREESLKEELAVTQDVFHKESLRERISNIKSNVATLHIGGVTEAEIGEKKDRIEDAIEAVQSAVEEGYVIGGGITYHLIADKMFYHQSKSQEAPIQISNGAKIVIEALREPLKQLLLNSGMGLTNDDSLLFDENKGIDFRTGDVVNMQDEGIIDSAKVARVALQNAAATAKVFLNISAIVSKERNVAQGGLF